MKKITLLVLGVATLAMATTKTNLSTNKSNSFFDRFHTKGDLRVRYETIEEGVDDNKNKYRNRYRFRYNVDIDIFDNIIFESAISSGKYNPTSGNVTFRDDDNWADYFVDELKIDIVDIKYSFGNSWIRVGKSKHNIYRPISTQLVWDSDIRLEGINYGYKNNKHMIRLGANRIHREKEYKDGDDINLFLAQYVNTQKIGDTSKLNLGAAYYYYDEIKGNTIQSQNRFKQNSNNGDVYLKNYGILEVFGEYQNKDLIMQMPFKAAVTMAYNTLASSENFAYDLSMELGLSQKLTLAATYRDIQKDAVYGAHNDSDFSGGGTDSKGYYAKAKYEFAKNVDLGVWLNWSELGDKKTDYHRAQIDATLKF